MPLLAGTKLGLYEILAPIGQGGMGEVYQARDSKLGREVAIKVLAEALRRDEERLARFEREARVLASLNHPGIATLYGLERSRDITYLVMELVPGETLQERLARAPLTIDEALGFFQQIAEALEAAHAASVVHRDLKPANIKITPEGRIKILDFGLAKAFTAPEPVSELSRSPTLTRDATAAGVILGTASYMSPEQAKGKNADKRADIWAFGAVLFEAITGRKAFDGESVTDVLANVIHKEASWDALPAETPWQVRKVLRRCLAKDPARRFHDIADARLELSEETAPPTPTGTAAARSWRVVLAAAVGVLLGVAGAVSLRRDEPPPNAGVQRFVIRPPLAEPPIEIETPEISADGRRIAYVGVSESERHLYVREMDAIESRLIEETEGATSPFFSPDGLTIGFFSGGKLKKVSTLGGVPIEICDAYAAGPGGSWAFDDTIWFSGNWNSGFLRVSAEGGKPEPVTVPDAARGEVGHWWMDFLLGGKTGVFTVFTDEGTHRLAVLDVESRTWRHLVPGMQGRYVPSGHILYYASGIYQAVAFDPLRGEVVGMAVPVLEGTRALSPTGSPERYFGTSNAGGKGLVATVPGGAYMPRSVMVWVDFEGRVENLPFASAAMESARLSPDGTKLAVTRVEGGIDNIWVYDLARGTEEKLTRESSNFDAQWTPDGNSIVFSSARRGAFDIFTKPVDALGVEEVLLAREVDESAYAISPDGNWLALVEYTVETGEDIALFHLRNGSDPVTVVRTASEDGSPRFSRDSSWLAFESTASGRSEVYVQAVADGTGRVRVSTNGGARAVWSPTADELYYVSGNRLLAARYRIVGGEFRAETPRFLVDLPEGDAGGEFLEISPDGTRFLILVDSGEDPPPTEIHVTTNWLEELKRLAPPSR